MPLSLPAAHAAVHVLACNSERAKAFPRRYRLARRDGFSRVLQQRAHTIDWFAVYWEESKSSHARLGVTVSKRIIPTAVGRNRIKRMVRERFRNVAHQGLARDIVIRLRRRLSKAEQPAARKVLDSIMKNILSAEA